MKNPAQIQSNMITTKLNQVNAAAEKHAAALAALAAAACTSADQNLPAGIIPATAA